MFGFPSLLLISRNKFSIVISFPFASIPSLSRQIWEKVRWLLGGYISELI